MYDNDRSWCGSDGRTISIIQILKELKFCWSP